MAPTINAAVALRLVRLRFSARMSGDAVMPAHKSSLFHGVFGRVLHRDFPYLYSELFGSGQADGDASPIIHPYILLAPPDELRTWEAGHEFSFELTLFGKAVRHAQACCDALRLVGRDGLGEGRAKFTVHRVDQLANVHGKDAAPDDKTSHARFPHPNPLDKTTSHSTRLQTTAAKLLVIPHEAPLSNSLPQEGERTNVKYNLQLRGEGAKIPSPQSSPASGRGGERENQLSIPESQREFHVDDGLVTVWRDGVDTAWIAPVDLFLADPDVSCARLTGMTNVTPENETCHARFPHLNPLPQAGEEANDHYASFTLMLELQTPLRLKHGNRLVRQPPEFSLLFSKLLARLNMLSQAQGSSPMVEGAAKARLSQLANDIVLSRSDTRWVEWNRYSSSQKASMQFGGLMGTLEYSGELAPFLPFLRMAELTHLGGKSTFGLGKVVCQVS